MKLLRTILDKQAKLFQPGGKLERLHPMYEAMDTFLFTPSDVTKGASHVRDALDLKRMMTAVIIALIPCILMALYNTGFQANLALAASNLEPTGWRAATMQALGLGFSPENLLSCFAHGALYFIPVLIVTYVVGGNWEALFSIVRKHDINEGFLVTGMLFPLILPPTIPLWQVAVGVSFGVVIGKEVFGGTGMNILNPALTARVFLFFAYPGEISGDKVWVAVDGYSGATWLSQAAEGGRAAIEQGLSWTDAFLGFIPGSMGETSTIACLFGAAFLILTRIGSWRTMAGITIGTILCSGLMNLLAGKVDNPYFDVPFWWHMVLGGWAFGTVFMATDPVSSAFTDTGKWIYGFFIGVLVILVRVVNPAYPEGMMLAILFMNVFAALIDHMIIKSNIKRRMARYAS